MSPPNPPSSPPRTGTLAEAVDAVATARLDRRR